MFVLHLAIGRSLTKYVTLLSYLGVCSTEKLAMNSTTVIYTQECDGGFLAVVIPAGRNPWFVDLDKP